MQSKYTLHPLCKMFPEMDATEFQELKDNIEQIGQIEPVELYQGKVLDGRHREKACLELGFEPEYTEVDPSRPNTYVVAKNIFRRHLTSAQRAMIVLKAFENDEKKPSKSEMADAAGVSNPVMYDVEDITEKATERLQDAFSKSKTGAKFVAEATDSLGSDEQDAAVDEFNQTGNLKKAIEKQLHNKAVEVGLDYCEVKSAKAVIKACDILLRNLGNLSGYNGDVNDGIDTVKVIAEIVVETWESQND